MSASIERPAPEATVPSHPVEAAPSERGVLSEIALDVPRVLVRGWSNAGKTTLALDRVAALVAGGAAPAEVLLVCAAPTAVADARRALGARGARLAGVRVATARDVELELLDTAQARSHTGRRARVLTDFEETFLLEDMRVTGLPARRLKGMLGFFRRSWTELADDDMASFIIDAREQMVLDAVKGHLGAYDAMLSCEVSNLCVNYLRSCPRAAAELGVRHIVVDDYQSLNRASQIALELMAPETLVAFADPAHAAQGSDPFPYLAGVEEFMTRIPGAPVVDLPTPAPSNARAAAPLLAEGGFLGALSLGLLESGGKTEVVQHYDVVPASEPLAGVSRVTYRTPDEEFSEVADQVVGLLADGVRPSDVLVLAPNRSWAANVGRALGRAGVPCRELDERQVAGGSFRELERCEGGRMLVALALLADRDDPLAWRCWCGCGDYMARSAAFASIEGLALERGVRLGDAIALLAEGEASAVPGQDGVVEAWRQGLAMVDVLSGLRGARLLEALARGLGVEGLPAPFCSLAREVPQADAAELLAAARCAVLDREPEGEMGGVLIASYSRTCGLKARHVIACGLMNGWVPPHAYFDLAEAGFAERQRMDAQARRTLYELAGCATETLTLTGFAACDLELAERLHLKGYRVSMEEDGRRVTTCRPSDLGTYALHAWGLADIPARGLLAATPDPVILSAPVASAPVVLSDAVASVEPVR